MDLQTGELTSGKPSGKRNAQNNIYGKYATGQDVTGFGDTGGASQFFYCAKASQDERNLGCEGLDKKLGGVKNDSGRGISGNPELTYSERFMGNFHPTVKPIALMRYLQRLVTPKGGICLDPCARLHLKILAKWC
jgi:site-specific DNA-methyltransferase (adenine-specific)